MDDSHLPSLPSIAMAKGVTHLVWFVDYEGQRYASGKIEDPASALPSTLVPLLPAARTALRISHLAVDASGAPGVVSVQDDLNNGYNLQIGYWRPSAANAGSIVKVMDTNGFQNDDPAVFLAYAGAAPRVLAALARDDQYFARYDRSMWLAASADLGSTWPDPANIASDGSQSLDPTIGLAFGPAAQAAIVTESNGGSGDSVQCNVPELSRSVDL